MPPGPSPLPPLLLLLPSGEAEADESDMACFGDGGTRRAGGGSAAVTLSAGLAGWRWTATTAAAAAAPLPPLPEVAVVLLPGIIVPPPPARWRKSSSGLGARGIVEAEGRSALPLPAAGRRTAPTSPVSARSLMDPACSLQQGRKMHAVRGGSKQTKVWI